MIVETDFATHWKTELLAEILKDPNAGMYLIRLWSHCQVRRCWVFNGDDLKGICRFKGEALALQEALTIAKFVDPVDGGRLAVHEWEGYNAQLVASWENGKRGGRKPKANPAGTQREPSGKPKANPAGTQQEPKANPAGTQQEPKANPAEPSRNPAGTQMNPSAGEEKRREDTLSVSLSVVGSESTEGDEAHRILVACPELRGLTWLQDRTARQFAPGLDYRKVAPEIVKSAMMMNGIEHPGAFVKRQYLRLIAETDSGKKEGGRSEPAYVPMRNRGRK